MILFLLLIVIIIFAVASVLILISNVASLFYDAPFVPIDRKMIRKLLAFGELSADDVFYDLGCGDGRVLISAAEDLGVEKAIGYEVSLWPYLLGRWRVRRLGLNNKIETHRKNLFDANLSSATFIYAYLFPKLIDRLAEKIACPVRSRTRAKGASPVREFEQDSNANTDNKLGTPALSNGTSPEDRGATTSNGARECRLGTKILCPSFPIDLVRHPEFELLKSEKIAKITVFLYALVGE